ncbi:MAG: cytochrome c biogenesis protein CcdA [Chloroflexota bacterium]
MQLSFSLALIAGFVSFLSPCVLPLVPAYIGYMSGRVTNTVAAQANFGATVTVKPFLGRRFSTMLHGMAFVAGFTFVFVAVGLLSTAFVSVIGRGNVNVVTGIIGRAGGLLIILFGLHFMGVLPSVFNRILAHPQRLTSPLIGMVAMVIIFTSLLWIFEDGLFALPFFAIFLLWLFLGGAFTRSERFWTKTILWLQRVLYADTRRQMVAQGHQSYAGSAIMGVIFSAGWTPCIGPIYGAILTLAARGGDVATAGTLLLAYSLGLGIPFLAAAFLLDQTQIILKHLQRHLHKIELVSGAFLVLVGVLVASGSLQLLSQNFANQFADFSANLEHCVIGVYQGEIPAGNFGLCMNSPTATAEPQVVIAPTAAAPVLDSAPSIFEIADSSAAQAQPPGREIGLEIGKVAPGFSTTTDQGAAFKLADLRGKVVILNFWATWCGPCRVEMPEFQKAYASKAGQGFTIVGVNNAEAVDVVAGFRDELKLTFPLLMDTDGHLQDLYGINAYPSTYVLNRDGVIVNLHFGPLTAEQIADLVNQALT